MSKILNFNIGVLGHVDCGKTSLVKALSTTASTACFDKNPESKERGITLDLGFSSFVLPIPEHLTSQGHDRLQITLVDCPGHASLIKTIIGGSQIIDLMLLVIDAKVGMQTQTAECLIIGEITCDKMIIVLNKVDLFPPEKREAAIEKLKKKMRATLKSTKFHDADIVAAAAKPGGPETSIAENPPTGLQDLTNVISSSTFLPARQTEGPALLLVDHCFSVKGQGTVMTGTVLQGAVTGGDMLEIPSVGITRKVKSMQMFRVGVDKIVQGDRAGVCVTQFDPQTLERGLVCTPGLVPSVFAAIISLDKIPYFKGEIRTKAKFHISVGHETVMAKISVFGYGGDRDIGALNEFDFNEEYKFQEAFMVVKPGEDGEMPKAQFGLLEFERCVPVVPGSVVIGSRLDTDIHSNTCRLAFKGTMLNFMKEKNYADTVLPNLKVFKNKSKSGVVERASNEYEVIVKDLFKKETNIALFTGLKVDLSSGEKGTIEGSFGQSGKVKVRVPEGLKPESFAALGGKKKKGESNPSQDATTVTVHFKRYMFDPKKAMVQTK